MTAPDPAPAAQPPLLDALVYALVDGSTDLADRGASKDVWDQATEDCESLLPVITRHTGDQITAALKALDARFERAQEAIRGSWNRRLRNDHVTKAAKVQGLGLARAYIAEALKQVQP